MSSPRFTLDTHMDRETRWAIRRLIRRQEGVPHYKLPKYDVVICRLPPGWFPTIDEPIPTEPAEICKIECRGLTILTAAPMVSAFNWGNPLRGDGYYAVAIPHVEA